MIIDKSDASQDDIPAELDGEVLLGTQINRHGVVTAYLTASQETCSRIRKMTPAQRKESGWDKHQTVLDSLPAVLPKLKPPA